MIRDSIFNVYTRVELGLLERIHQAVLKRVLEKSNLKVKQEIPVSVLYDNVDSGVDLRLDLLVENKVIIELKSVEVLKKIHYK